MSYTVAPSPGSTAAPRRGHAVEHPALRRRRRSSVLSIVLTGLDHRLDTARARGIRTGISRTADAAIRTGTIGLYRRHRTRRGRSRRCLRRPRSPQRTGQESGSRIVTWVVAGVVVLCCGCGLAVSAFTRDQSRLTPDAATGPTPSAVGRSGSATALPGLAVGRRHRRPHRGRGRAHRCDHPARAAGVERLLPQGAGGMGATDVAHRGRSRRRPPPT